MSRHPSTRCVRDVLTPCASFLAGSRLASIFPVAAGVLDLCFFSLALVKRYSELTRHTSESPGRATGRGYAAADLPAIGSFGVASGFISVLVLVLYVLSVDFVALYDHPERLLLICPLLLYWISRLWMRTTRGLMHEDPVLFALTDRASYITGALSAAVLYGATSSWLW